MTDDEKTSVAEALTVTLEVCGAAWSLPAFKAVMMQLDAYQARAVLAALQRCQLELTGRLSLAVIIERIDDGRPTPDEAWAQVGTDDESRTLVCTTEAMTAMGEVRELLADDRVAARMAFLQAYKRIVAENKAAGIAPNWYASAGTSHAGRAAPIMQAVERGRLTESYARMMLGEAYPANKALGPGKQADQLGAQRVGKLISGLAESLSVPERVREEYKPPDREEVAQIRAAIEAAKKACA